MNNSQIGAPSRHDSERAFFDERASKTRFERLSSAVVARYSNPGRLFQREFAFHLLGNLAGKSILDVGCGDGKNAVLLARLGAEVTGLDISSGAIELAKKRCSAEAVGAQFICEPLEGAALGQYDVVWVEALLHHVLHDIDNVVTKLISAVAPGGTLIMIEPVNLFTPLRAARLKLFSAPDATPGERPLEVRDLEILRRHLPQLRIRRFRSLGRLDRFILPDMQVERAPTWKRLAIRLLALADYAALSVPGLRQTASVAVIWAKL